MWWEESGNVIFNYEINRMKYNILELLKAH